MIMMSILFIFLLDFLGPIQDVDIWTKSLFVLSGVLLLLLGFQFIYNYKYFFGKGEMKYIHPIITNIGVVFMIILLGVFVNYLSKVLNSQTLIIMIISILIALPLGYGLLKLERKFWGNRK